jgi:DNA polymerase I-like protein with 3'-5' exonuclease and polymerase domains
VSTGGRYVFDLETDGFLPELTKIHSLVIKDIDTGVVLSCADSGNGEEPGGEYLDIRSGLAMLRDADELIGHNIVRFDIPAIKKVFPQWSTGALLTDTMVMSRLIFPDTAIWDSKLKARGILPPKLFKSHSLKAWGLRLQILKGDFTGPWERWSPVMQEYCEQDVQVTSSLYEFLAARAPSTTSDEIERGVAKLCWKIEQNGFPFDRKGASELYSKLCERRMWLEEQMKKVFQPRWVYVDHVEPAASRNVKRADWGTITKPRFGKTGKRLKDYVGPPSEEYTEGAPYSKIRLEVFNPGSRHQIADRLIKKYKWRPKVFTDKGQPKVDETTLKGLKYPEAKLMAEYFMIQKRIGQIAEGDQAWLKLERDGKIHASYQTNGAVSGRATHRNPNIAQVPRVGTPYGKECRNLFIVPPGWKMIGVDLSGLELRCLGHYMAPADGGEYIKTVVHGDPHTTNQKAAGLPTRDKAKTFIYMMIYGGGDGALGEIVGKGRAVGKQLRSSFLNKIPAIKWVKEGVEVRTKEKGFLLGLDGRHLPVRSEHSALNLLLQSAGAVLCKKWILLCDEMLQESGLSHDWDGEYAMLAWVHDELQIAVKEGLEDVVGETCRRAANRAGEFFEFRAPIDAEFKVGSTWAETH